MTDIPQVRALITMMILVITAKSKENIQSVNVVDDFYIAIPL